MVRLGKEDNFWEIGSGPCGPCSEIYFDRGPEIGLRHVPTAMSAVTATAMWSSGTWYSPSSIPTARVNYTPLEHKNIDTGMGLERLACIMQGVDNLFEVDTVQNIMKQICRDRRRHLQAG